MGAELGHDKSKVVEEGDEEAVVTKGRRTWTGN